MPEELSSNKLISGFSWVAFERVSIIITQFILGIVIARLIPPEEYGVLGILMVFISISEVFVDSGFGSALIYYNDLDKRDLSTVFVFNVIVSAVLYLVLFLVSPYIERFFNLNSLSLYLRVSALVLFSNSLILVPTVILKVKLNFKVLSIINLSATGISGIIGVIMAYCGFGIWALIAQLISKTTLQAILLFFFSHWLPTIVFFKDSFKKLFKFGINVFSGTCITKILEEGSQFFIAKFLNPFNLGIFTRSNQFASLPSTALGSIISFVIFPSLSFIRNDRDRFWIVYRKAIDIQAAITIPIFVCLAVCSEPLVSLLLTDKWIAVVPVMQILCLGRILVPIAYITEQMMNALGRSDLFLKQQVVKMILRFSLILSALYFGIIAVAIADMTYTILQYFVTYYYSRKINEYKISQQLQNIYPFIVSAILSGFLIYVISYNIECAYIKLTFSSIGMVGLYWSLVSLIFKRTELNYIWSRAIQLLKHR